MDEYEKLKYNPQFLKKAYDLVKDDFPKLFKDGDDYTEEDEKNWNIALNKIYDNFVTPEEDDFIEIWGETDGTIGLIDYVHENENQFMESSNKYVEAFRESCRKLEEDDGNPSLMQAIDYDVDNDEMRNDKILHKEMTKWIEDLSGLLLDIDPYIHSTGRFKNNKKLEKFKNLIREAWRYGIHEFIKDVNDNYIKADEGENNFGYDYQNSNI